MAPFGELLGAEFFVEFDGRLVPVEGDPFHAGAVSLVGDLGELNEDFLADAALAVFGFHEDVLEIQPGASGEGGEILEINRKYEQNYKNN